MEESIYKKISDERLLQVEYWKRKCTQSQAATTSEVLRAMRHLLKHYAPTARDDTVRVEWLDLREALRRLNVADELTDELARVESVVWEEDTTVRGEPEVHERVLARLDAVVATLDGLARVCEAAKTLEKISSLSRDLRELRQQNAEIARRAADWTQSSNSVEKLLRDHIVQLNGFNDLVLGQNEAQRETLTGFFTSHPPTLLQAVRGELAQLRRGSVMGPMRQAVKEELEAAHLRLLRVEHEKRELTCLNSKLKAYNDQLIDRLVSAQANNQ